MRSENRRQFLARTGAGLGLGWNAARLVGGLGLASSLSGTEALAQIPGQRPAPSPAGVRVVNPRNRVPVSLIIDDSTCLVNLAHFCIPQFQEVFPKEYRQPWKTLPREIPDAFVRKFAAWCHEQGVQGKYSLIPYPACVGWLDRDLPGWSRRELESSLELVRTAIVPDWDIHPEIVSHTWVVDTKTGRPYPGRTADFMENWGWSEGKSADQLADYMSYALRILKDVGMPCTGITTPGGFGIRVLPELAEATLQSCRDVFQAEIPHYFRHAFTDEHSVAPRVEYGIGAGRLGPEVRGLDRRLHGGLVRRMGWPDPGLCRPFHHGGSQGRAIARGDRPRRARGAGLPLAGDLLQWPGDRLQDLPGSRETAARRLRQPDLDEAELDRPLLGRPRADANRTYRAPTARLQCPLCVSPFHAQDPVVRAWRHRCRAEAGAHKASPDRAARRQRRSTVSRSPSSSIRGRFTSQGNELLVCFDLPRGRRGSS